jgi:hypothetical protein
VAEREDQGSFLWIKGGQPYRKMIICVDPSSSWTKKKAAVWHGMDAPGLAGLAWF